MARPGPFWLRFSLLDPWTDVIAHGITERTGTDGDSFDLSSRTSGPAGPRRWVAAAADLGFAAVARPRQVHGATVTAVDGPLRAGTRVVPDTDALITTTPGVLLGALFADCTPVLLLDPVRPAVAAIHAGWRGAAGGIVPATVAALHDIYGADPARLRAGIGPTIGPCCFEVGPEVIARFSETPSFGPDLVLPGRGDRAHLDLPAAIEGQLRAAGVRAENIERASLCTRCQNGRFFSYRAEGPDAGRFAAFIGLIAPGKAASAEAVGP